MPVDPSSLTIVHYPDPVLRETGRDVDPTDEHVRDVARRMIQLMYEADGIGLAAPQVGLPWRLFVCHVPPSGDRTPDDGPATCSADPLVFFNPVLSEPEGPTESETEGCLSLPDVTGDVMRPRSIRIDWTDRDGTAASMRATGLLARCMQHEVDHLDGVLILDRMSHLSRLRSRLAVRSLEKAAGLR